MTTAVAQIVRLPRSVPPLLAMGAWFSNTLCLTQGQEAHISHTIGHLDSPAACREHAAIARQLLASAPQKPVAIVQDLHPDFYSSRMAAELAEELAVPLIAVQHHHAHIAALCAEHGVQEPILGLALDGVGLGTDGTAWGGELLRVDGTNCERLGYLRPLPLPGGDRAAEEPWRMAAAALHQLGRNAEITQRYAMEPAAATVAAMLQRDIHCPRTSSMGRVFDAASGLLGLCHKMEFEAQGAIVLEQAATAHVHAHGWPPAHHWSIDEAGRLDLLPLLACLAVEQDAGLGAALFHATLVAALADWVAQAASRGGIRKVAGGGGCFFNRLLSAGLREKLADSGLDLLTAQAVLPGDSAIALGQAWVAAQQN